MKDNNLTNNDVNMMIMETNNKDLLSTSFPERITILYSLKKNLSTKLVL